MAPGRKLYRERSPRMIVAMNSEPLPAVAVRSTILKLGAESLDFLVAILVSKDGLSTPRSWNMRTTHLRVLSRNLNLIEFAVLELGQVVAQ